MSLEVVVTTIITVRRIGTRGVRKRCFLKEMYSAERRAGVWGKSFCPVACSRKERLAGCTGLRAEPEQPFHLAKVLEGKKWQQQQD